MARIVGVDIPNDKPVGIALTYIFGIGRYTAKLICDGAKVDSTIRVKDLTDAEFCKFREVRTAKMGSGRLYRSSTPINTRLQRNYYADRLARAAKVKTFLNLCDT